MYDAFSLDYDRFVNWTSRLAYEMPFIERQLSALKTGEGLVRVLDAACGTGKHAVELARHGYAAYGADLSQGMVEQAYLNAAAAGVDVEFKAARFGDLRRAFAEEIEQQGGFDAVLCLGNSLPHVRDLGELDAALADFAACLRPGGLLLLQNRNFDAVMAKKERWMDPQAHREGEAEWLFVRFYDFTPEGKILFHIVTLYRFGLEDWQQRVMTTELTPLVYADLDVALVNAGFSRVDSYGDLAGSPFDPNASGNLVIAARR